MKILALFFGLLLYIICNGVNDFNSIYFYKKNINNLLLIITIYLLIIFYDKIKFPFLVNYFFRNWGTLNEKASISF